MRLRAGHPLVTPLYDGHMRRFGSFAVTLTALLAGLLVTPPATQASLLDASSESALVGPVRYTATAGVQDPVYGASFVVIGDAYAENPISGDDTVVLTLTGATSGTGAVWFSRTNRLFPAGGGLADDTVTLMDPTTPPARVDSGHPFTILRGDTDDDTVLQTYVAVNAPGTYAGDVRIYEGSQPTMSSASLVQHTSFRFTTAGVPRSISLDDTRLELIATPADLQTLTVQVLDDSGRATQLTSSDQITISTSNANVAAPALASLTAADFDDSLVSPLGGAPLAVNGGSQAGTATVTLTPLGTLPSSGVRAVTAQADSIPLTTKPPGLFEMVFPTDQRFLDEDRSSDDTAWYVVNDIYVNNLILVSEGADPNTGIVGYVTTSASNWKGLIFTGGPRTPVEQVPDSSTDVPVVLASGSDGTAAAVLAWDSVTEGGRVTLRTGTGSSTRWTVIEVEEPTPEPRTSPSGRITAKSGEPIDFIVTLRDDFGNPYPDFKVRGQARSSRGTPVGPVSAWESTDSTGRATVSVDAPDDTHIGPATIVFTVTLPSGTPYTPLTPPVVRVTYSETGQPTALTVAQAQSTPSTIGATTMQTVIPYVVVPYLGEASTSDGTPGMWTAPTATAAGSGTARGTMVAFTPTSVPATQLTVTAPEGVFLSERSSQDWDSGETELSIDSGTTIYAFSTEVGTHSVTFSSGTLETRAAFRVATVPNAAYSVSVTGDDTVATGSFSIARVSVLDPFGNPVPGTSDDSGGLTATTSGQLLLTGLQSQASVYTDDSGVARLTLIAGGSAGDGQLLLAPLAGSDTPAWQPGFKAPFGFPAPRPTATLDVRIVDAAAPRASISIVGERTTVRDRPGILIEGTSAGLDPESILRPWVKVAGRSGFTQGAAEIRPDDAGDFSWSRRGGKKVYVYVATSDGSVRSNRVTIP